MVAPHARALALMADRVEASGRALLLFAAGLDDVDRAEGREGPFHEVVEPGFGYLPAALAGDP